MIVRRRGWEATVRSVLGDTRAAEVHPGDGFPWITCPFCGSAVYLGEPHPDHAGRNFVAKDGRCNNPWCLANPATPLDAARNARGRAMLEEMADAERRRNSESAMRRIEDERATRQAAWDEIRTAAEKRGACVGCAWEAFNRRGTRRLVRHRGPCPLAVTARNQA